MKAAIFDLDGTLVDSIADITDAANHALTTMGHRSVALDEYRYLAGSGNNKLMARALRVVTGTEPEHALVTRAVSLKLDYESGPSGRAHARAFPGVHDMLHALQAAGIVIGILSNKTEDNVRVVVSQVFPDINFAYVAGAREDTPLKPDPSAALTIVKDCMPGVRPEECVFVGDTDVDMKTGRAAGMTPVGVPWGFRTEDELRAGGAEIVVGAARDIADFVLTGKR